MAKIFVYLFLLLLLIVTVTFTTINVHPVQVNYYVGSQEVPLAVLLGAAFIIGTLVGALIMMKPIMKLKLDASKLRRSVRSCEKEISILRTLPLKQQKT